MTTSPRKSIVHAELNVQGQTKSRQRSPCQHSYDYNPLNSTEYVMHTTREQQKGQLDTVRAQVEELQNLIVASSEETVSLRKEVGIKEARIMLLEGQLARSQCRQSELNDDTDDHRFEMNQLRETIGTYEQELEILRSEGCTRAAAHAKLEFEASELERVNADLLSQNRSLQSQIQVKDKILQDREIELSRLQSVVDGSGVGPDGQESCLSILRDRNARLQKELLASVQQVRQYREKSLETVKKLQELDFEKAAEQRRCHAKEVECEELKSRLESMSAEIAKYDEELRRRMVDVRTFKERYETLRSSFDTLQIQAKYKEDLLGKLSGELKDYSGVAVSSHEETARLRIELRKYIDECTALNEKLNTFRSMHEHDISERRSTIESLQMRLHESVETVAVTDLDVMSKAYDIRLRAMQDKIHHLREELVATQAKNVELRSGNLQNEQYHEDLASREHYINEQENTVEILQGQVHDLSQEIRSRIDVEHRLSSQIDALEVENTKLKIIASHAEARIQSLEQRVHIHEKEVTTQRENIEWTADREVRYIRQVEDLREKLKYKQDECEVLRAQCARWGMYEPEELALLPDYQARLQSYAAEVETLHELLHQKMKELEDYQELDSWANRARDKIDRLQESSLIHEEMAQLQEARDTIHALERRVEVLTEAAALVHQQAIVLEKENERLHEEVIRLQGSSTNHQNQRGVQERDSIAVVAETHPRGSQPMGINATARSVHERYLRPTPSKASQNAKDVPDSSVISQYKFRNSAVFREHPHPGLDGPSYSSSFLANVSPIPKAPYSARTTGSRTAFATTHGYDTVDSRAMHWDDSRTENIPPLKTMPIYAPFHGLDLPKSPPRLNSARPNRQHHVF